MAIDADRKRTIEARLDRLQQRLARVPRSHAVDAEVRGVTAGILDLLRDVLLTEDVQ